MREYQEGMQLGQVSSRLETGQLPARTNDQRPEEDRSGSYHGGAAAVGPFAEAARFSPALAASSLLSLQRQCGNAYVQRVVGLAMKSAGESEASPEIETSIERNRGGGQGLDRAVSAKMGRALNADLGDVRVHTGAEANTLNHALNARAFTTGRDIFFREGEYNPGSAAGRELLAHELTHVVQQNSGLVQNREEGAAASGVSRSLQAKLSVGSPGDIYEQEADNVARAYSHWEQQPSGPEEGAGTVRREMAGEEKPDAAVQAKPMADFVRRQPEEEKKEEMVRTKPGNPGLQRASAEDEKSESTP